MMMMTMLITGKVMVTTIITIIIKITISPVVIGLKKHLFLTNLLAKLLSDSLLSDSSTNQSHSNL